MSLFWDHFNLIVDGKIEQAVYYWWFIWLREVEDYDHSHPLYKDFGDVKGTDFKPWFGDHEEDLFSDGPEGVMMIECVDRASEALSLNRLVLALDRQLGRKKLLEWVDDILEMELEVPAGRPTHESQLREARYEPHGRPDCPGLKITYLYWQHIKKGLSDLEVAQLMGDIAPGAKKHGDTVIANQIVGRQRRRAERLIANVSHGMFPCFD